MANYAKQLKKEKDAYIKSVKKIQKKQMKSGELGKIPGLRFWAKGGSIVDGYEY